MAVHMEVLLESDETDEIVQNAYRATSDRVTVNTFSNLDRVLTYNTGQKVA